MRESRRQRNAVILGMAVLICVIILLLASPAMFFSSTVTFIDTDLNATSSYATQVKAKTDFGNQETMAGFPLQKC
jgi:hypothetical protein